MIAHVHATHVASGLEGISQNVRGLTRALARRGTAAHVRSDDLALEDLNGRGVFLSRGLSTRRLTRDALADASVELAHVHVSIPLMGRFLPRARGKPVVLHVWNALYERPPQGVPWRARSEHALFNGARAARAGLGRADAVVVSSLFQAEQLAALGHGDRVRVAPSGVDPQRFRPATDLERTLARETLGIRGDPVILYFGHLSPWKGVDVLVDALPSVLAENPRADAVLSVTGYGGKRERLAARLASRGIADRTRVLGPSDAPTLLAAADVVVVPQVAPVGTACYPNVLLEALASGVPVVASRTGCIPDALSDPRAGLLAEAGDPADLSRALRIAASDATLRRRMGRAARALALERFTWDRAAALMCDVYAELGVEVERARPAQRQVRG